jgi:hypothetical protein
VGDTDLRYIDSGTRDPAHALGQWLKNELEHGIQAIRVQSGFFGRDALRPFIPAFAALAAADRPAKIVIGSNDGQTLAEHVRELFEALSLPRGAAGLGLVYLSGAFFHPKTYHLTREDGSQTAYVGSANFTLPGISARHIEAGILLDTAEGDAAELLSEIATATDAWFVQERPGFERIVADADIDRMLAAGIISAAPTPRPPRATGAGGNPPVRPSLPPLLTFPPANAAAPQPPAAASPALEVPIAAAMLPVVQRTPPYPPYMNFAPDAETPTYRVEALSGTTLGDAAGLILRLSRDNDRHWREAPGTANVSIPIATASTLRFGLYGDRARPRAEFDLELRYLDDANVLVAQSERIGIMSFGFTPGDTGHSDLRLAIPRPPVRALRQELLVRGLRIPQAGDLALLEWPTPGIPVFRMTVSDPASSLGQSMLAVWNNAPANAFPSRGACWLPVGIAPLW